MKICDETELLGTLEMRFQVTVPPGWPLPAWKGWGFASPSAASSKYLDLSDKPLESVLRGLCPAPSYVDLRHVTEFLTELESRLHLTLPSLEEIFALPDEDFVRRTLPWLKAAPLQFWHWCDERSIRWGQIRALALLQPGAPRAWLIDLVRHRASSQEGQKILEWCVELELMGIPPDQITASSDEDFKSWQARLRDLRFPLSEARVREGKDRVEKISWPKGVAAKWSRQGDKQVLEVRLIASSKQEYTRQLERLLRDERSPWT